MNYLKINVSIEFPMAHDTIPPSGTTSSESQTRLGSYLIEAGLITPAQVAVVLNDQNFSQDMRFGEVLVARGWVKSETIEFVMKRVVEPERKAALERQNLERQNAHSRKAVPAQQHAQQHAQSRQPSPPPIAPPMPTTPPRVTTPRVTTPPIARAKSIDGDFEFEILDDITLSLPNSLPNTGIRNDRKPLSSIPDGGGVNWAG
jgi:DNA segregation ATPase FtsK/SpoIIIE-like protein